MQIGKNQVKNLKKWLFTGANRQNSECGYFTNLASFGRDLVRVFNSLSCTPLVTQQPLLALKYIPKGEVRTALEKVNNAAQGRSNIKNKYNKQLNASPTGEPYKKSYG